VANNAAWCDAVCRSHGYPGEFTARTWLSPRHNLPFYPNAITLDPDATAADTQAAQYPDRAYGVKDSFARLDLAAAGLTPLFDADWIAWDPAPEQPPTAEGLDWKAVDDAAALVRWEAAWAAGDDVAGLFRPALLADPGCAFLACYRDGALAAGAMAYTAAGVTGLSNLFESGLPGTGLPPGTLPPGTLWRSAVLAVAASGPGSQPLRSWATIASACARVKPSARPDKGTGTVRLPPARKTTWSFMHARRSGYRSAIAICSRSMPSWRPSI
jgi:hypothetical protein